MQIYILSNDFLIYTTNIRTSFVCMYLFPFTDSQYKAIDDHDLSGLTPSPAANGFRFSPFHFRAALRSATLRFILFIVCHQPRLPTTRVAPFLHFAISNLIPFRMPRLSQTCNPQDEAGNKLHFIQPYRAIPVQEPHLSFACTHLSFFRSCHLVKIQKARQI